MNFLFAGAQVVGRAAIVCLLSGCSLSVLDGLTGGRDDGDGSPGGPLVTDRDASLDRSAGDAADARLDVATEGLAEASEGKDRSGNDAPADDLDGDPKDGNDFLDIGPNGDGGDAPTTVADGGAMGDVDAGPRADADAGSGCGCVGDGYCAETAECIYPSCLARLRGMPGAPSGVAFIDPDGEGGADAYRAYCEMVADGGGFTLVLKVSGTETRFLNHSALWENNTTYRPEYPDLDTNEAKLASYSGVAFTSVRLGMVQAGTTHWLVVPMTAASFLDLMNSGYRATALGREAWKSLPASGSLQTFCSREGFNVTTSTQGAVRIGILGNELDSCSSCDSWIGFGGELTGMGYACGNVARWQPDNGERDLALFGYVMVR